MSDFFIGLIISLGVVYIVIRLALSMLHDVGKILKPVSRHSHPYTRRQSLKHAWYQRFNSRSNSVPWGEKYVYKSDAWARAKVEAMEQYYEERSMLYANGKIADAKIASRSVTKSGAIKLWVDVHNPFAQPWNFGDINGVTIRKKDEKKFWKVYGEPEIGKTVNVILYPNRGGHSYRILYDNRPINEIKESQNKQEEEENIFIEEEEEPDDDGPLF